MGDQYRPYTTRKSEDNYKLALQDDNNNEGWVSSTGSATDSIRNLSIDLPEVSGNAKFTRNDISVPSPWAAIISYDIILNNTENEFGSLGVEATNEWRALITLIALRDYLDLNINYRSIDLEKDGKNKAEELFYKNLISMTPKKSIFGDASCWNKFVFLTLNNYPIGMFSNSTLICPRYQYTENSATKELQRIGMMDKDFNFTDPVKWINKDLSLSLYVAKWLEMVKMTIISNAENSSSSETADTKITTIIKLYEDDLKNNLSMEDQDIYEALYKDESNFYKFKVKDEQLSNAYELLWGTDIESMNLDSELVKSRILIEGTSGEKSIFLLDSLGKDIVSMMDKLNDKCKKPEGLFYDTKSLLLDTMTLVEVSDIEDAFEPTYGTYIMEKSHGSDEKEKKKYQYILPIKNDVLGSFPIPLLKNITIEEGADDDFVLSLDIPVGNRTFPIKHSYKKADCKKIYAEDLPMIAIWPYAEIYDEQNNNVWKDYYIYSANKQINNHYTAIACCDNDLDKIQATEMSRIRDNFNRQIYSSEHMPKYLSVFENKFDYSGNKISQKPLGIIVLPKPKLNEDKKITIDKRVTYLVGFDFGTTATTAFCRRLENISSDKEYFIKFGKVFEYSKDERKTEYEDSDLEPSSYKGDDDNGLYIAYKNHYIKCEGNQPGVEENEPSVTFIPSHYPKRKSYMSLYNINSNEELNYEQSLRYGNVIFDQGLVNYISDENLIKNLKWGTDGRSQQALSGYLSQMMKSVAFTLAKSGAGSIRWRFSYPTSLSEKEHDEYERTVNDLVKHIGEISGLKSTMDTEIAFCPESIASAKFLQGGRAGTTDYICIDIGGGSSDISMWQRSSGGSAPVSIMQFSIGIASRKIFLPAITDTILKPTEVFKDKANYCETDLQKKIRERLKHAYKSDMSGKMDDIFDRIKNAHSLSEEAVQEAIENFSYLIEPLLITEGNKLQEILRYVGKDYDNLLKFLMISLGGILYYIAKSLAAVKYKLKDTSQISVCLAGNGSKMYSWLGKGNEDKLKNIFTTTVKNVLGRDNIYIDDFIYDEKDLKTEAARGLLRVDEKVDLESISKNLILINCGKSKIIHNGDLTEIKPEENIHENNLYKEYYETGSDADYQLDIPDPKGDLEEFCGLIAENYDKQFLSDFKDLDENKLHSNINIVMRKNKEGQTYAPAFIVELEALLRTMLGY